MATTTGGPGSSTSGSSTPGATPGASTQAASAPRPFAPAREVVAVPSPEAILKVPVVYRPRNRRGRRRRDGKRRYSSGTKQSQRFLFGTSKAGFRMTNALSTCMRTYTRQSDRSRRRKRDGMVRDVFRNMSRGFADGAAEFGRAPGEVANRISTKNVRRMFRFFTPFSA